jgi:glycosyltransferase involved in cell wall biosynthesis
MDRAYDAVYTPALEALGVSCLHAPDVVSFQHYLKREGGSFNLILSCRPDQTQELLPLFQRFAPQARILYETHDLHFIREQRQAELEGKQHLREQAVWRKNQELGIMAAVDCTLVVSEDERRILQTESPGLSVEVIPVVSEIFGSKVGFDERRDLVFIGGFEHRPNVDAVKFFVQEILPLILSHIPDIRFHVIGSHPPSEITELASANIVVHGFVPDLSEIMNHVRISVNPVRFGAGVKGKLVTSLSYGVPCIGTHIAVEGMQLEPGLHALVADTPQDFAEAVAQLYRDKTLWRKLSAEGLKFVQRRFSLDVAANSFAHIFKDMFPFKRRSFVLERIVSSDELRAYLQKKPGQSRRELGNVSDERFDPVETHAFCWVCNRKVTFRFESSQGDSDVIGNPSSSWIKGMVCPSCRFDGPARAGIHFFHLLCAPSSQSRICLIDPTPLLFAWFQEKYSQVVRCECPGRAALPDEADAMKGSRDLLPLGSLPENMFDAIVFFDNLPEDWGGDLSRVFTRCLKPGGNLFLSISREQAAYRTAESAYPIDSHDPNNYTGQDGFYMGLFEQFQGIGLSGVAAYCYWSQRYGYMESDQILFKITK